MSRPTIQGGEQLEPVPLNQLPGPRKFNQVQAVANALLSGRIIFVQTGKTGFVWSGRNLVLQISLADIGIIEVEAAYKDLWILGGSYDPGDIVRTQDADPTATSLIGRMSFWVWNGPEQDNSLVAPNFYNTVYGEAQDGDWRCISSIPGRNVVNGFPPVTASYVLGGLTFTFYEGLLYSVA